MSAMDTDLPLTQFRQLEHDYIGYQSLTDVPRALSYSEELKEYSVSNINGLRTSIKILNE